MYEVSYYSESFDGECVATFHLHGSDAELFASRCCGGSWKSFVGKELLKYLLDDECEVLDPWTMGMDWIPGLDASSVVCVSVYYQPSDDWRESRCLERFEIPLVSLGLEPLY